MKSVFISEEGVIEPSLIIDLNLSIVYRSEEGSPSSLIPYAIQRLPYMEQDIFQHAFYPKFQDKFNFFIEQEKLSRLSLETSRNIDQAYPENRIRFYSASFCEKDSTLTKDEALSICEDYISTGTISYFNQELLEASNVVINKSDKKLILSTNHTVIAVTRGGKVTIQKTPKYIHRTLSQLFGKVLSRVEVA